MRSRAACSGGGNCAKEIPQTRTANRVRRALNSWEMTLHHNELMVRTLDAHGRIEFVDQPRTELREERNDRIEALLQMLFRKYESVKHPGVVEGALVVRHDLCRRLAGDLRGLVLDLAAAGAQRGSERRIELIEIAF